MSDQQRSGEGDVHRSLAIMWAFAGGTATRGPKPQLSVRLIVDTAIRVADADGLEALSMRRVASELGVGTMSLYRYVPGKAELLDLMLDRVNEPPEDCTSLGDDWRTAMETMARGLWTLYTEHKWLPWVDQSRPVLGPNAMASFELALAALAGTGFSDQERVAVISLIDSFVQGAARMVNAPVLAERRTGVTDQEFWAAQAPVMEAAMRTGAFPEMQGLSETAFAQPPEEFFEFGLTWLLDGLDVQVRNRG
ncbi:TetR/AcrR family transcriptional regulator [Nocardioides sp.]|uniref:TetR/AcrR family transcriptional regulator n=1 Tax=Nocardioides sp. TaxID=35761 RepID=UPI002D99238C|nr:TetR/AcrR family transcriptional regulator [Pedococcus sp.]